MSACCVLNDHKFGEFKRKAGDKYAKLASELLELKRPKVDRLTYRLPLKADIRKS